MTRKTKEETKKVVTIPAGFEVLSSTDVELFWSGEGPLIGVPLGVKLFDSSIDESKYSALVVFRLSAPARVVNKDKEPSDAGPNSNIGVWYKPGMRGLERLTGREVFLQQSGTKDVGKGNPMVTYVIGAKAGADTRLPVLSDTRSVSKRASTPFDALTPSDEDLSPVPF